MFEVGQLYDRRREIHEPYGGQQQGGISTPREHPFVLLFTSQTGEQYGYEDGWEENGVFLYTGGPGRGSAVYSREPGYPRPCQSW
jgi:5-methylcytosine-specific restriction protein A